nr:PREDICTED: uncharacterized protein LOC109030508 [Bemisia tabaci]
MLEDDSECLRASSTPSLASLPVHKNRKTGVHFGIYREKTVPEYLVPKKPRVNLHHSRIVILTIMASGIILVICLTLLDFTMTQTRSVPVIHYARYRLEKNSNQNSQDSKPRRHNYTQADPKSDLLLYSSPLSIRKSNSSGCSHCGSENEESLADVKQIPSVSRSKRIPFVSSETDNVSDEFHAVDFQSQKLKSHEDKSITEDKAHHSNGNMEGILKRKEKASLINDTSITLLSDGIDTTQQILAETEIPDINKTDLYTHENTEEFSTSSTDSWTERTSPQSEKELSKMFEGSTESWTEKIPFEDEEFRMGSEEGDPSHNLHYVYVEPKKPAYVTPIPESQNPEPEIRTTIAPENHRRFPARPRSRPAKLYSKRKSPNSRSNGARALPQIQILESDSSQQPQKLELISPQVTLEKGGVFEDDSFPDPNPAPKSETRPMERRISFADFEEYPQLSNYKNLDHVKSVMDIIQYLNTESPFEGTSKDKLASNSGSRRKERHRQRTNARAETQNEPTDDPYTAVETVEKELTYPPDFGDTRPVDNFVPLRKRIGSKRYDFDAAKNQESNDYLTSDLGDIHSPVIPDDPEPSKILDDRAQTSVPDFIEGR